MGNIYNKIQDIQHLGYSYDASKYLAEIGSLKDIKYFLNLGFTLGQTFLIIYFDGTKYDHYQWKNSYEQISKPNKIKLMGYYISKIFKYNNLMIKDLNMKMESILNNEKLSQFYIKYSNKLNFPFLKVDLAILFYMASMFKQLDLTNKLMSSLLDESFTETPNVTVDEIYISVIAGIPLFKYKNNCFMFNDIVKKLKFLKLIENYTNNFVLIYKLSDIEEELVLFSFICFKIFLTDSFIGKTLGYNSCNLDVSK